MGFITIKSTFGIICVTFRGILNKSKYGSLHGISGLCTSLSNLGYLPQFSPQFGYRDIIALNGYTAGRNQWFLELAQDELTYQDAIGGGSVVFGGLVELGAQRMGKKQLEKRVPTGYSCNEFKLLDIDSFPGNINYTPIPAKLITVCHSCPLKEGTVLFYDFFHLSGDMFFLPAG